MSRNLKIKFQKRKGFTLLEIVVAMAIFSICVAMGLGIMSYALEQKVTNTTVLSIQEAFTTASATMVEEIKGAIWPGYSLMATDPGWDPNAFIVAPENGTTTSDLTFLTQTTEGEYSITYYLDSASNTGPWRILKKKALVTSTTNREQLETPTLLPLPEQVTPWIKLPVTVNFVNNNGKITIIMVATLGVPGKENYISSIDTTYVRNWVPVPQGGSLTGSVDANDPNNPNNPNFTANFSGGSGLLTYLWSDGETTRTSDYSNTTPGQHTPMVTVTDALGQTLTRKAKETVTITGLGRRLTVTVLPLGAGWVDPSTSGTTNSDGTYPSGTSVTLTESPGPGASFVNWSGAGAGTATTTTVTMNGDEAVTANFRLKPCTLVYTAGANGTISGTTPQTVNFGANGTTVTAVPSIGYQFVNWSDGGGTTATRTDINVVANITATATFAISTYSITASAGSNGTVTPAGTTIKNYGATQVYTIVPATGYHIASLTVDGKAVVPIVAAYTFSNTNTNHTINATFAIDTYTLTYTAGAKGTITGVSPQLVKYGAGGTEVTAVPNTGYHFVNWGDNDSTVATRTDSNVTGSITTTAAFAINTYTLTASAGRNGTVTPIGEAAMNFWESQTYTITPDADYTIASLMVDGKAVTIAATYTFENITLDHTIDATFAINTFTLTYIAGANGTISGITPQTVNSGTSGAQVIAVPSIGYHFVKWSDGGTTAIRIDGDIIANMSVTATFEVNVSGVITIAAGGGGTVTPTATTLTYAGNPVTITATAEEGYAFASWAVTGNPSAVSLADPSSAVTTVTATSNMPQNGTATVTATFAINTYTLTYTAGANGIISGVTPQTVNYGTDGVGVAGVPNINYHFVKWSDGVATPGRRDTDVTTNKTVTATFALNTFLLTYTAGGNGTISGTTPQTVNLGARGMAVTAVPNTGYSFVSWSDGLTTATRTDTNVTANVTVTVNFSTNWTHTGAVLTGYTGPGGAETMPSVLDGVTITSIGANALNTTAGHLLTSVTIPNSITSIGDDALEGCSRLTSVTIPASVTIIGTYAFYSCSGLTRVTIGSSVASIGDDAFWGCSGLTNVTIPSSVTSIGAQAFGDCTKLTSITVEESNTAYASDANGVLFNKTMTLLLQYPCGKLGAYAIPNSVSSISAFAFAYNSGLTSVSIPASVTSISEYSFLDCSLLTGVTIGSAVTSIGDGAFQSCGLTSVSIPYSVTSIGAQAFQGCGLTSVSIPDNVTSIGNSAFEGCYGLTSVIIGSGVTSIGARTFYDCTVITSVTIGSGVTSIGAQAFESCDSLVSVTIPAKVTSIGGYYAFYGCQKLVAAYFLGNAPTGTTDMFSACAPGFTVHYLSGKTGWTNPWYGFTATTP